MHGHNYIASSAHLRSRESHPPHGGSARRLQHPEDESGVRSVVCCIDIPVMIFQSDPRIPEPGSCASNRNWVAAIKLCFLRSLTPSLSQPIRGQYPRQVISPSQSEAGITPDPWPPLSHSLIATLTSRFLDPNNNPKMVTLPSFWLADNSLARILRNNSTDN